MAFDNTARCRSGAEELRRAFPVSNAPFTYLRAFLLRSGKGENIPVGHDHISFGRGGDLEGVSSADHAGGDSYECGASHCEEVELREIGERLCGVLKVVVGVGVAAGGVG